LRDPGPSRAEPWSKKGEVHIALEFDDNKLASLPLTASFKDESLTQVLTVLDLALGLRHELNGRKVVFYSSGKRSGAEASQTPDRRK